MKIEKEHLKYIAAPMVNQSDLPFRCLVEAHGATMSYTQMLIPERLLDDQEYLEFHLRDLTSLGPERTKPVVVQLCGNEPETVVRAGKKVQNYCDAIGALSLQRVIPFILMGGSKTLRRSKPRLSTRGCKGRALWCIPAWPEGLACRREHSLRHVLNVHCPR